MTKFHYKAFTSRGVVTTGVIAAEGMEAAIAALYDAGLTPFETHSVAGGAVEQAATRPAARPSSARTQLWKREEATSGSLSLKELTAFTVELSSLVGAGLPLDAAFRIMAGPGVTPKTGRLVEGLLRDVLAGSQLSEAMAKWPDTFAVDYRAIIGAGEAGGAIGDALRQVAQLLNRRLELHNKIMSALVYPAVLILMSLISILVIMFVLVPAVSPIFVDAGLPLPGILGSFEAMQENWIATLSSVAIAGIVAAAIWNRASRHESVRMSIDRQIASLPVAGTLVQAKNGAGLARALGTLLEAGVPLIAALQTSRSLITNRYLAALCDRSIGRVPEGTPLHRAFDDAHLLSAASLRLMAVGEESGQLSAMLLRVANLVEADLQRRIERMVGLLTPLMTVIVGGSIGLLIMQVMSAVLSINNLALQ